jgi:hypothetical protein
VWRLHRIDITVLIVLTLALALWDFVTTRRQGLP